MEDGIWLMLCINLGFVTSILASLLWICLKLVTAETDQGFKLPPLTANIMWHDFPKLLQYTICPLRSYNFLIANAIPEVNDSHIIIDHTFRVLNCYSVIARFSKQVKGNIEMQVLLIS